VVTAAAEISEKRDGDEVVDVGEMSEESAEVDEVVEVRTVPQVTRGM
jgi:hypothetical protein